VTRPARVVIVGGGVAALEALMALRDLAGERVQLTLVAPEPDFVYRPLAVAQPFCLGHPTRYPLADITLELGAALVRAAVVEVDHEQRRVMTDAGEPLEYDSLLVAVGARMHTLYTHALTFGVDGAPEAMSGLLADLEDGNAKRVAFVVPTGATWTLPLYELAIITARHVWEAGLVGVEFTLVTPESRPLELFGAKAAAMVAELLASEGIEFVGSVTGEVGRGEVQAGDRRLPVDRTVTLPVLLGPTVPGLPQTPDGFIPVDAHGRVAGLDGVFAAGDATDSPIKQGGLAAQQAVAAAEAIAARHGADLDPQPFRPVLRGVLLTGGTNRWLRAPAGGTPAAENVALHALWWPPTKISSRYLAVYLQGRDDARYLADAPGGPHALPVERDLELPGVRRPH
jgi:sulfide:quinone oxidoreductase